MASSGGAFPGFNAALMTFPVEKYRQGGTDRAAMAAAIQAAQSAGAGVVLLDAPLYQPDGSLPAITLPTISMQGPGSAACVIKPTAAVVGDLLRVQMNPFTVQKAGSLSGFTLDGSNAGAGACGLHYGDTIGGELDDLVITHFNKGNSRGLHLDNVTNWTERLITRGLWVTDNTIGALFDVNGGTNSFGYCDLEILTLVDAGQVGIQCQAAALIYDGILRAGGNTNLDAVSPPTFLKMLGNAMIQSGLLSVHQEANGAGNAVAFDIAAGSSLSGFGIVNTFGFTSDNIAGTHQVLGQWNSPSWGFASALQMPQSQVLTDNAFIEPNTSGVVATSTRLEVCWGGAITRTINAQPKGQMVTIRNDNAAANVTIAAAGGSLHGANTLTPGQFATYISDGVNVFQVG